MLGLAGIFTTSRARRAAVGMISPMVAFSIARHGEIPAAAWRHPYMIGFLSVLISLIASQKSRYRISSEDLGIVQGAAWQEITGLADDRIGEDICLLSVEGDGDFLGGCADAVRFADVLYGGQVSGVAEFDDLLASGLDLEAGLPAANCAHIFGRGGFGAAALWIRYFEDHLR